jgi:hypothetical protein
MSKEMISVAEISLDESVKLIKKYRIANKRAGEAKREGNLLGFQAACVTLRELSDKAKEKGFHLWTNVNGKTGHTYAKDYRETPDSDNDYEAFIAAIRAAMGGELPEGGGVA